MEDNEEKQTGWQTQTTFFLVGGLSTIKYPITTTDFKIDKTQIVLRS